MQRTSLANLNFSSRYPITTSAGDSKPVILLVWFEISFELKLLELKVSFIIESTTSLIFLAVLNAVSITSLGVSGIISCIRLTLCSDKAGKISLLSMLFNSSNVFPMSADAYKQNLPIKIIDVIISSSANKQLVVVTP